MPRSFKLTWQAGGSHQTGRWRKKYRGQVHYFPGGRGKSDREAYEAAVATWEALKVKIDAAAPRPHESDYMQAIEQWEQVLAWCNQHDDAALGAGAAWWPRMLGKEPGVTWYADLATRTLDDLRRRLAAPRLTPLARDDWFESVFDPHPSVAEFGKKLQAMLSGGELCEPLPMPAMTIPATAEELPTVRIRVDPDKDYLDGSPQRIAREIWRDRLEVQQRKAAPEENSVKHHIQLFLDEKKANANAGEVSIGRLYAVKLHLAHFQDWFGKDRDVEEIDGQALSRYRLELLEKTASDAWTKTTAKHYLMTAKSFVRWLWTTEAIATLPRILAEKSSKLTITVGLGEIVVFTKEEITSLLAAPDRTKLYILLMLNCGMTQKDIADLAVTEVNWEEGRIKRKRSKTGDCENVPTVNYKLWAETFRLLRQERAQESDGLVLLNSNGSPLWTERMSEDGKYQKTDNVKNAFDRLRKTLGITKPLKSLKKTSASLLRNDARFSNLENLFLDHAPQKMSDRHYAQVPQDLLDQAIQWLGAEYGLA